VGVGGRHGAARLALRSGLAAAPPPLRYGQTSRASAALVDPIVRAVASAGPPRAEDDSTIKSRGATIQNFMGIRADFPQTILRARPVSILVDHYLVAKWWWVVVE
jgi:hypothetical protein